MSLKSFSGVALVPYGLSAAKPSVNFSSQKIQRFNEMRFEIIKKMR